MNPLLKLGVGVVGLILLYGLVAPLAFFIADVVQHPEVLKVSTYYSRINATAVKLVVTISYNGTVELKDVKLVISGKVLYFGNLRKGSNVSKSVTVTLNELQELWRGFTVSFNVAGLYPIELKVRG